MVGRNEEFQLVVVFQNKINQSIVVELPIIIFDYKVDNLTGKIHYRCLIHFLNNLNNIEKIKKSQFEMNKSSVIILHNLSIL